MTKLPRRRIQRAFIKWWRENRLRFLVPVHIEALTGRLIRLRFGIHHGWVSATLTDNDFNVSVEVSGVHQDILLFLDSCPVRTSHGHVCSFCEQPAKFWPTREALWADHLFEPLLQWANTRLMQSSSVRLGGTQGGSTWAELVMLPRPSV